MQKNRKIFKSALPNSDENEISNKSIKELNNSACPANPDA
jgi:hypothetical protein